MVGDGAKALHEEISAEGFAKNILGFEEIQDEEDEATKTQDEQIMFADGDTASVPEESAEYGRSSPAKSNK